MSATPSFSTRMNNRIDDFFMTGLNFVGVLGDDLYHLILEGRKKASPYVACAAGEYETIDAAVREAMQDSELRTLAHVVADNAHKGKEALRYALHCTRDAYTSGLESLATTNPRVAGWWQGLVNSQLGTKTNYRPDCDEYTHAMTQGKIVGFGMNIASLGYVRRFVLARVIAAIPLLTRGPKYFAGALNRAVEETREWNAKAPDRRQY